MIDAPHDVITPFDGETPRRDVVRTMGAAGAALLGMSGLGTAAQTKPNNHDAGAEHKRRKRKKCRCKGQKRIGLTSAESEPFSLDADEGVTERAVCPDGFIALSGGLQGESEVTAPCMIRESHPEPDGSAWVVNVFCTEASNTPLRVGAICLSLRSFDPVGQSGARLLG